MICLLSFPTPQIIFLVAYCIPFVNGFPEVLFFIIEVDLKELILEIIVYILVNAE